jgi:hypothetical protein
MLTFDIFKFKSYRNLSVVEWWTGRAMKTATWDKIKSGPKNKERLEHSKLSNIVDEICLTALGKADAEKLTKSYYESVDRNNPVYQNFTVPKNIEDEIVKKADKFVAFPIVLKLFFEKINKKIQTQTHGGKYVLNLQDMGLFSI